MWIGCNRRVANDPVTDVWPPHDNPRGLSKRHWLPWATSKSLGRAGWNRRSTLLFVRRPVYRLAWPRSLSAPQSLPPRLASRWHGQRTITFVPKTGRSGSSCSGILTAGYGVLAVDAFPAKLERALRTRGQSAAVANAGVSGDTAAMGLARLNRSITDDTNAVILELGANDMLRGFEPSVTRAALVMILRNLEARRIVVLLCGVRTQPNRGDEYKRAFAAMFSGLASEHDVLFYPAFDDAFVDDAQLKLPDGLHPTAAGIEAVVTRILPKSRP